MRSHGGKFGVGLFLLSLLAILMASGCGSGSSTKLRVVNASPNQGNLDVLLDGKSVATMLGYINATDYLSTTSGSRHLQLEQTGTTTIAMDRTIALGSGTDTTFILTNTINNLGELTLTDEITAPTGGELRLVHVAPGLGAVDVYVLSEGIDINNISSPTISNFSFQTVSNYLTLPVGSYHVYFTPLGNKSFAYISAGPISLTAGQVRTVLALNDPSGIGYTSVTLKDLN